MTTSTFEPGAATGHIERPDEDFKPVKCFDNRRQTERLYTLVIALAPSVMKVRAIVADSLEEAGGLCLGGGAGLDLKNTEQSLRGYAADRGKNLAGLLEAAGRHVLDDRITPRSEPLTNVELDELADDDARAFDD